MLQCTADENEFENERKWYALYTRPQWEKKVESEVERRGIETFLPLQKIVSVWSDRKKMIERPLFPSYLFVYTNFKERLSALEPGGVVRMVSFNGSPAVIPTCQIESIRLAIDSGSELVVCPCVSVGERVEITAGSLQGATGYVIEMRQSKYVVISVEVMNRAVAVQIDPRHLRAIRNEVNRPRHSAVPASRHFTNQHLARR